MCEKLSTARLFLRYAIGCVDTAHHRKRITAKELGILVDTVKSGAEPDVALLHRAFPKAFERIGAPYTFEKVAHFWRVLHMYDKESPVFIGQINMPADEGGAWSVHYIEKENHIARPLLNMAELDLQDGDRVYCHGGVIAEKVPVADPF